MALNSTAKRVVGQALFSQSVSVVSALDVLLVKDDVFGHQSDTKDT